MANRNQGGASIRQDNIRNDNDFLTFVQNMQVIESPDQLPGMKGGTIRYKLEHHVRGKVETKYRLGGLLTYVHSDSDYITLKNAKAERQNGWGTAWSVQLRLSKPNRAKPDTWIPVFPSWVFKSRPEEVTQMAKRSPTGVIIITLWGSPPMSQEYARMKALLQQLEASSVQQVVSGAGRDKRGRPPSAATGQRGHHQASAAGVARHLEEEEEDDQARYIPITAAALPALASRPAPGRAPPAAAAGADQVAPRRSSIMAPLRPSNQSAMF